MPERELATYRCNVNGETITDETCWIMWSGPRPKYPFQDGVREACEACATRASDNASGFFNARGEKSGGETHAEKATSGWDFPLWYKGEDYPQSKARTGGGYGNPGFRKGWG